MDRKLMTVVFVLLGVVLWNLAPYGWVKAALLIGAVFALFRWSARSTRAAGLMLTLALVAGPALSEKQGSFHDTGEVQTAQLVPGCNAWCKIGIGIASGAGWDIAKWAWGHYVQWQISYCKSHQAETGHSHADCDAFMEAF